MSEHTMTENVRIGTVTDIDAAKHMARVKFQDQGITSGWLFVIQRNGATMTAPEAGEHSHTTGIASGHTHSVSTVPDHKHEGAVITGWMPKINDTVLCLYIPIFNGDGFIIGGIG